MLGRVVRPLAIVFMISAFLQENVWAQSRTSGSQKVEDTQEQVGAKVLESVSERGDAFDPAMRAAIEFLIGRTYERVNPVAAEKHLATAYDIVRYLSDRDQPGIGFLKGAIVTATAVAAPNHVEQALPGGGLQDMALGKLVEHYIARKEFDHAIELFDRIDNDDSVAAAELMMALGPEHPEERTRVFAQALRIYRGHNHPHITAGGPEDLGTLVVRFWRDLPPELVHDAIDELLKQADPENAPDNSQVRKASMSATGSSGTVTFKSLYEFRLFQLVPILRAIDVPEADRLMKDAPGVQQALHLYPQGDSSLDPTLRDTPLKDGETSTSTLAISNSGSPSAMAARHELWRRTQERLDAIGAETADHPQQALTDASMLPDAPMRVQAYLAIAAAAGRNESVANLALKKALDTTKQAHSDNAVYLAIRIGQAALTRHDNDVAASALKVGLTAAREVYGEDAKPGDPNLAVKIYWPSTQAWRDLITLAAKIAPNSATDALKDIPDEEIKAVEEVFLAGIWMKVDPWRDTSPIVAHKGS